MERKFKVGDKVKLNKKIEDFEFGRGGTSYDEIGTVIEINRAGLIINFPSHSDWWGLEEELVLADEPVQSIHIYSNGTTTTAVLKEGRKVVKEAKATCHEDDEFNFETGAKLAFERLFGDSKEYKEVKREANIGEYIKIVAPDEFYHTGYEKGDILKVTKKDLDGDVYGEDTACIHSSEYVVLEGYKPPVKEMTVEEISKELGYEIKVVE